MLLPVAAQLYVMWRTWQLLPFLMWAKVIALLLMALAFVLFFVALSPQLDRLSMTFSTVIYHIGTSWLIIMFYLLLLWLFLDLLRVCHVVPASFLHHSWAGTVSVFGLLCVLFTYGYVHYRQKERVPLSLTTSKPLSKPLRIVMTSDWHLGYHNRQAELSRWIDLLNAEQPDLILVAGDIIDRSIRPLDEQQMAKEFHRLSAPVYACLGNHEYYSGEPQALRFYHEAGIHLLRDSVVALGSVVLIGRDDRTNPHRLSLAALMKHVPADKYSIVLDHQPYHLDEVEASGVDFQLSGHTHYGQVWPISWITAALYECAFGPYRRGKTQFYVSSGLGIWGGKFRIGTRSEYVVAELRMDN